MPIVTIVTKRDNTPARVEAASGGCFGFMASTGFFRDDRRDTQYVGYHIESGEQEKFCKEIFDGKNNLFPYHKYMTAAEFEALWGEGARDLRHGTVSHHGYVVVEMQPEGYEGVGIPQDMFISGLFTARNLNSWSLYKCVKPALNKKYHPMLAYVVAEMIQYEDAPNGSTLRFKRNRVSSSNIDTTAFGVKNLKNMFQLLTKGKSDVGYFGHEGGIIQRGGYKRDHNFSQTTDIKPGIFGDIVMNMNTSSAPIDNDVQIINPYHFSPAYLGYVLNELLGAQVFDMSKMLDRSYAVPNEQNKKMYFEMRDVRFRKSYRKGDVVEPRFDMLGEPRWVQKHGQVGGQMNVNRNNIKAFPENAGLVPVRTRIEKVDRKRGVECYLLENGTWVAARYIKMVGTHPNEGVKAMEGEVQTNALYTAMYGGKKVTVIARTYDLFEGTVRCTRLGRDLGLTGADLSYRRNQLKPLFE